MASWSAGWRFGSTIWEITRCDVNDGNFTWFESDFPEIFFAREKPYRFRQIVTDQGIKAGWIRWREFTQKKGKREAAHGIDGFGRRDELGIQFRNPVLMGFRVENTFRDSIVYREFCQSRKNRKRDFGRISINISVKNGQFSLILWWFEKIDAEFDIISKSSEKVWKCRGQISFFTWEPVKFLDASFRWANDLHMNLIYTINSLNFELKHLIRISVIQTDFSPVERKSPKNLLKTECPDN
jgi:hypothetical protein